MVVLRDVGGGISRGSSGNAGLGMKLIAGRGVKGGGEERCDGFHGKLERGSDREGGGKSQGGVSGGGRWGRKKEKGIGRQKRSCADRVGARGGGNGEFAERVEMVGVAGNSEMGKGVSGMREAGGEVGNGGKGNWGEIHGAMEGGRGTSRGRRWKRRRRGVDVGVVEATLGSGGGARLTATAGATAAE